MPSDQYIIHFGREKNIVIVILNQNENFENLVNELLWILGISERSEYCMDF